MNPYIAIAIIAALVFLICFLVDKGFSKLFRSQSQHHSGTAVRLNKRYGSVGLVMTALGVGVLFAGLPSNWLFIGSSVLIMALGVGLVVYYMTFGVFYDQESFILTTFGRRSTTYRYDEIRGQQLYITTGNHTVIEIILKDGRTFHLQSAMPGVYDFMDTAFSAWLTSTGKAINECDFYDPKNSCWFPTVED